MRRSRRHGFYVPLRLGRLASALLLASWNANWNLCLGYFNDQICCIWNFIIKSIFRALAILLSFFVPQLCWSQSCCSCMRMSPKAQHAFFHLVHSNSSFTSAFLKHHCPLQFRFDFVLPYIWRDSCNLPV